MIHCDWRRSVLAKKATLSGNAMIRLSLIGQRVIQLLLYLGLYLAGEQLGRLSTTILLLKRVLERLWVLRIHGKIRRKMILSTTGHRYYPISPVPLPKANSCMMITGTMGHTKKHR